VARSTTFTYTVTVVNPGSGNKYYMDGILQTYITLFPGCTYEFNQDDSTNSGHPLRFATQADAANSSEYTTGVTSSGTPGSATAWTKIEVTSSTPYQLFFYCTAHSGMGNTIDCVGVSDNKDRGCQFGGEDATPAYTNTVEYWQVSSLGNANDFGDLTRTVSGGSAIMANNTIGCCAGTSPSTDTIDYIVFETRGNGIDFGNLTVGRASASGVANKVRGVCAGGRAAPVQKNEIDFITIPSAGNATDFGDLTSAKRGLGTAASPTRGLFSGEGDSPNSAQIDYITIMTTGNSADFGDLTVGRGFMGGTSSSTRGLFAGGAPGPSNVIDYVTIATLGNATDFGNLTVARTLSGGASNNIKATFSGGSTPSYSNVIDYITISSTGNATDYGDLITANTGASGSNGHGGLQ
tara:strand:+ start:8 stop:1231 length:1224 start_codon:yes stop_codon:yes gene_type:complete